MKLAATSFWIETMSEQKGLIRQMCIKQWLRKITWPYEHQAQTQFLSNIRYQRSEKGIAFAHYRAFSLEIVAEMAFKSVEIVPISLL